MRAEDSGARMGRLRRSVAGAAGRPGIIAAAACMLWASPLAAQERAPAHDSPSPAASRPAAPHGFAFRSDDRPRLGIYLRPGCAIVPSSAEDCSTPPVVAGVVEGAPAAAAGIQPGDTLLSIDGVSLRSRPGRRAMAQLEEGRPIRLEVGRASGRRVAHVTPTARPMTGLFQMSGTAWRSTPRADVHVYRLRDNEGGVAEFHLTPTPERPTAPDRFVVFREDETGALRVDVGHPDVQIYAPDGRRVELRELERRVREAAVAARAPGRADGVSGSGPNRLQVDIAAGGSGESREPPHRLIIENAPLARRLESIHRGTLAQARNRIDSVIRSPAPPSSDLRLAGAEFRALTAELAEYFPVDEGLLVLRVIAETPADRLGLRGGDVVIEAGGRKLPGISTFRRLIVEAQAAERPLEVKWNRKGQAMVGELSSR